MSFLHSADLIMWIFHGIILFIGVHGQITQPLNSSCAVNNITAEFTFVSPSYAHSTFNITANCSVSQCNNSVHNCHIPQTPCYNYRTIDNISYCAPASNCSMLEVCNTNNYTCSTNTSICVINSCCEPRARCLPLLFTTFCPLINETPTTITTTATIAPRYPISCFSIVTASNYYRNAGTTTQQGDGLVDRPNTSGGTYFNAGAGSPQWVQLELPAWYNITAIALKLVQVPNGQTRHQLLVGSNSTSMQIVNDLSSTTYDGQWLNFTYNSTLIHVRFVRVYTISSPSWVAWEKFIVYDL